MINEKNAISLLVNIPPDIYGTIKAYLDSHPGFDQDALFADALHAYLVEFAVTTALEK
jgi:hypothetical protein